jgi:acyl-coenzyme A thioesterase 13
MDGDAPPRVITVEEGEFKGWRRFDTRDTFDNLIGPFFFHKDADGRVRCAFRAERKHMNAGGRMHGGVLMTFADIALFMLAYEAMEGQRGVTVQLDSTFLDGARVGDLVEASGEVTRTGGSLIFVRGQIVCAERLLFTFSGVIKKMRPKEA